MPSVVPYQNCRPRLRNPAQAIRTGKKISGARTVAALLAPIIKSAEGQNKHGHTIAPARALIVACGHKTPETITSADCVHAFEICNSARYSPDTRYSQASNLRRLLRILAADGADMRLPAAVPRLPKPAARAVTLAPGQINRLIAMAPAHLRLLLLLCHDCALRSTTAAKLTWQAIQGDCEDVVTRTKRSTVVRVPVSGRLRTILQSVPKGEGPLIQLLHGSRIAPHTLRKQFRLLTLEAELPPGIRLHDLRRTMAQSVYAVTSDLRVTQSLLGHDSIHSTFRYLAQPSGATSQNLSRAMALVTETPNAKV
jgi:integrase